MTRAPVPILRRPVRFSPGVLNAISDAIPSIGGGDGLDVSRAGSRVILSNPGVQAITRRTFYAKITSNFSVAPNQWEYQYAESLHTGSGYGGWTDRPNGRTGVCHNWAEIPNSAEGMQGNGVNVDNLPAGFSLQPITTNSIVFIHMVKRAGSNGQYAHWFHQPNGVDGICPPP